MEGVSSLGLRSPRLIIRTGAAKKPAEKKCEAGAFSEGTSNCVAFIRARIH
jgi:hypothetical protein